MCVRLKPVLPGICNVTIATLNTMHVNQSQWILHDLAIFQITVTFFGISLTSVSTFADIPSTKSQSRFLVGDWEDTEGRLTFPDKKTTRDASLMFCPMMQHQPHGQRSSMASARGTEASTVAEAIVSILKFYERRNRRGYIQTVASGPEETCRDINHFCIKFQMARPDKEWEYDLMASARSHSRRVRLFISLFLNWINECEVAYLNCDWTWRWCPDALLVVEQSWKPVTQLCIFFFFHFYFVAVCETLERLSFC